MHSQYKYKGDNRYLSFHERLCRFNQNKINRIIESAFSRADNKNFDRLALLYKIMSQNSKTTSTLFQLNHISKYFQIMKI